MISNLFPPVAFLTGSPSSFAALCTTGHSPGKACRSTAPAAPSYSSRCFQTEDGNNKRQKVLERNRLRFIEGGVLISKVKKK
uniref:Uncharacterized protein n=1 Tax=Neogobius melanostomus TaxID=47308 RepID=A0A8C6UAK6_9GOBI